MIIYIFSEGTFAVETGRPLDTLHDNESERLKYLDSLDKFAIIGLLLSDPENFFTTSNKFLVKRFNILIQGGDYFIGEKHIKFPMLLLRELKFTESELGKERIRNLVSRLVRYGIFIKNTADVQKSVNDEKTVPVFTETDSEELFKIFTEPLEKENYDDKYVFLLGNLAEDLGESSLKDIIKQSLENTRRDDALNMILAVIDPSTSLIGAEKEKMISFHNERIYYNPSLYTDNSGCLTVVNVFDPEGTDNFHWPVTKKTFSSYGRIVKSQKDENIEYIEIEVQKNKNNARIILMMGKEEATNPILAKTIKAHPKGIYVFRGHSYDLLPHFPESVFSDNGAESVLFFPGSCGSTGMEVGYLTKNKMIYGILSNRGTGFGLINLALTKGMIDHYLEKGKEKILFSKFVRNHEQDIVKHGGEARSISYATLGQVAIMWKNCICLAML